VTDHGFACQYDGAPLFFIVSGRARDQVKSAKIVFSHDFVFLEAGHLSLHGWHYNKVSSLRLDEDRRFFNAFLILTPALLQTN
jgi:hypothetical protein